LSASFGIKARREVDCQDWSSQRVDSVDPFCMAGVKPTNVPDAKHCVNTQIVLPWRFFSQHYTHFNSSLATRGSVWW
jgi:hypothetical protein